MDDKQEVEFLRASGYQTWRKRMMVSCTLYEFFRLFEKMVTVDQETGETNELKLCREFLAVIDDEVAKFDSVIEEQILKREKPPLPPKKNAKS